MAGGDSKGIQTGLVLCWGTHLSVETHIFSSIFTNTCCLGEEPRRQISEDQYWSCQNAAKIRRAEVCHQERWICTHSPFIRELSGENSKFTCSLHVAGGVRSLSLKISQTVFYNLLSLAAPLAWGRLSKHKQTRYWTVSGKTFSI